MSKADKEKIKRLERQQEELMNLIKAIILKFDSKEIIVRRDEIEVAKSYDCYVVNEFLRDAKKYQVRNSRDLLRSYIEEKE